MANDCIGSIAIFILESFNNVPAGVSGNMIEIVDMARQHVENYCGNVIGSNSINIKLPYVRISMYFDDTFTELYGIIDNTENDIKDISHMKNDRMIKSIIIEYLNI